jgi:ParB family chromosome partitioning protein
VAYKTPGSDHAGRPDNFSHGVIAGEQYWFALHRLVDRGAITIDEPVLCAVVADDQAVTASLAWNIASQKQVGLAELLKGFALIAAAGKSSEEIAAGVGVPLLTVRRYVRLAKVSPRLFELFRSGNLELDQLAALTLADSHQQQEAVWDGLSPADRVPAHLRRTIIGSAAPAALVRFLGLEVYEQAGGRVILDLFNCSAEGDPIKHVGDTALLRRLALEKLNAMAGSLRSQEGWAWVDVLLDYDYEQWESYEEAPTTREKPTARTAQAMNALSQQANRTDRQLDGLYAQGPGSAEEDKKRQAEIDALEQQSQRYESLLLELDAQLQKCAPELAGAVGAMLVLKRDGGVMIRRNLLRKRDLRVADTV